MTIANQVSIVQAIGNGVARTFKFSPMVIYTADELIVIKTTIATGAFEVIARGSSATSYGMNVTSFPGTGSINYPTAGGTLLASTERLSILLNVTKTQLTDLGRDKYFPEVQEDQYDKFMSMILNLQGQADRSLHIQQGELTTVDTELPSMIGNEEKYIRVNATGTGFELVGLTGTTGALSSAAGAQVVLENPSAGSSGDLARADHTHQTPDLVKVAAFAYAGETFI